MNQGQKLNAIMALFDTYNPESKLWFEDGKWHLSISQMYEYVGFRSPLSMLTGMMAVAKILDCENGDEVDRYNYPGCETCDYGSSYFIEWCEKIEEWADND